jgi:DNA polymerase III gamma/tau subunit
MIGAAADLKEIDAASFTGIDDWKTIREGIQYHPMGRGVDGAKRRRAVIVDECHMLSKNAWASLLKDTEDVPGHLYWFFCTSEASKVPAAIKGRSACMDLRAVDPHELAGLLEDICEKEGYDTPTGILDLIASESGGSPRQAIAYLDVARECTSKAEASVLMQTHASSGVVIEIAKGLVYGNLTWDKACAVATSLHGKESAETIRRITVAYVSKALLNSKKSKAPDLLAVMEAFSAPFHSEAKAAEILLPVGKLLL